MGALHDSTNTNGSQGELPDDLAAMNGGDKDGHGTGGEGASTQAARKGKKDGKRKQAAELPKSPEDNGKAKVKRSRELAALEVTAPPPVSGAANRPSRTALSKEEQDKVRHAHQGNASVHSLIIESGAHDAAGVARLLEAPAQLGLLVRVMGWDSHKAWHPHFGTI